MLKKTALATLALLGAVALASADNVQADVGGNWNIQTLSAQSIQTMEQASAKTKSARMQALGAASAGLAAKQALRSPTASISVSVGSSNSTSTSTSTSSTTSDSARGASVGAANSVNLQARGAGQDSNILVQGSSVQAGNSVLLAADNQVQLQAATNTATQTSSNTSSSGSVGLSIGNDNQGTGINASRSQAQGQGHGQDLAYTPTRVEGAQQVTLQSTGDTQIQGAVVQGKRVTTDVGGNLNIQSLQDASVYAESNQNTGGSLTVGPVAAGSVSVGGSNIASNYRSANTQSGIRAGDGGFGVHVTGNTALKGGAITSTDAAVQDNKNSFETGGVLTLSDIANQASYSAESYQVSMGSSSGSAGAGQDRGSASSTTQAAMSGIAGNQAARTGDKETGIQKIFDANQTRDEINAQVAITSEFGKQASKAVGDYAQTQYDKAVAATNESAALERYKGCASRHRPIYG